MAGRVVWGGRRGTRGLRAGGARRRLGKHPPSSGRHNAPRGPGSLFPQSTCPWARPGGTQPPPPPTKGRGSPPRGSLWGRSLFYSHVHDSPHPSRFPTAPQPAAPSPCCSAAPHGGKNKAQPCTNRPLLGSSQSVGGGGGQCVWPLGAELSWRLWAHGCGELQGRMGTPQGQTYRISQDTAMMLRVLHPTGFFGSLRALHALRKC